MYICKSSKFDNIILNLASKLAIGLVCVYLLLGNLESSYVAGHIWPASTHVLYDLCVLGRIIVKVIFFIATGIVRRGNVKSVCLCYSFY